MSEYLKHKYSKRVWEVVRNHGEDHPYLRHFPYIRNCNKFTMEKFYSPHPGPIQDSSITVSQEIEWERRQLQREKPLVVTPPSKGGRPTPRRTRNKSSQGKGVYTLADLCIEIGMEPPRARKLLREGGMRPPTGSWKWSSREEALGVKRFLEKF